MIPENELDSEDLEVGQIVQYEKKYHSAAVVEITEDLSDEEYVRYEVEILEPIFGYEDDFEGRFKVGHTKNEDLSHYVESKFKKPGSMTDYCNAAKLDEHREKMNEIKEKYRDD